MKGFFKWPIRWIERSLGIVDEAKTGGVSVFDGALVYRLKIDIGLLKVKLG